MQLAACDAASNGWPPSTLQPLLHHTAVTYNQELIPLLAKPLVLALQHQRQDVADAVMDVLMREAALDTGDLLAEALLLLAYQVSHGVDGTVDFTVLEVPGFFPGPP
jgi:hypothetical protein